VFRGLIFKRPSTKPAQRGNTAGYFFVEEYLPVKATGVCSLLNAYPGTQSGKLLGGKLATKENHFSTMSLAKHCKPEKTIRIQHYFISNIYSKMYYFIGILHKNLNKILTG